MRLSRECRRGHNILTQPLRRVSPAQALLVSYGNITDFLTSLSSVSPFAMELRSSTSSPAEGGETSGETTAAAEGSDAGLKATSLFTEAAAGNAAAGVSAGLDLIHAGLLITAPVSVGFGVLPWLIFVVTSLGIVSPIMHLYLDHIIMRGVAYSVNILRHKNWGAAVLLGTLKVLLALVLVASYNQNCEPSSLYTECSLKNADSFAARLGEVSIPNVFTWQVLTNLLFLLLLMLAAKGIFLMRFVSKDGLAAVSTRIKEFSLDDTLADPKNNAVAVSLAAFALAMGLNIAGVVVCPNANPGLHAAEVLLWTFIGCVLLVIAFAINDRVLLATVSNTEALLANNVAIACFEGGSFIACGVILRGTLIGGGYDYGEGLALTVLYFAVSQFLLLITAYLYRLVTKFDDWEELKNGNVAAGLSGAFTLVAIAVIMAYPIPLYVSLIVFLPIAVTGIVALVILRVIIDKFVLPGEALDKEIVEDKNWGAAIIEGAAALGVAFIFNRYVPPPGPPFVSPSIDYFDVCS